MYSLKVSGLHDQGIVTHEHDRFVVPIFFYRVGQPGSWVNTFYRSMGQSGSSVAGIMGHVNHESIILTHYNSASK